MLRCAHSWFCHAKTNDKCHGVDTCNVTSPFQVIVPYTNRTGTGLWLWLQTSWHLKVFPPVGTDLNGELDTIFARFDGKHDFWLLYGTRMANFFQKGPRDVVKSLDPLKIHLNRSHLCTDYSRQSYLPKCCSQLSRQERTLCAFCTSLMLLTVFCYWIIFGSDAFSTLWTEPWTTGRVYGSYRNERGSLWYRTNVL